VFIYIGSSQCSEAEHHTGKSCDSSFTFNWKTPLPLNLR